MHVLPMLLASLLLTPNAAASASALHARVRPLSGIVRSILDDAVVRSPTIDRLVRDLQQLDTIVYVDVAFGLDQSHGTTSILTVSGTTRLLRVLINARLDPIRRFEILGHELFHALEIARDPTVRDAASFRAFYTRHGYSVSTTSFETDAARAVEARVRTDLSRRR